MNKLTRLLTAVGLSVALLGCGSALAAGESTIAVQLDGQALTFTDAVPQVQNERTFLPFRAVFEALGAEVDWDADTGAISAVREDKTVTMLPGSTDVSVEDGGVTTAIQMDVAPYAAADENGVWRTYVPVRFAAQAFDCAVGWDQAASTVILIDTDKLVKEALKGKEFTYLEKLADYSKKYSEGIWDVEMTMDGAMTMLGMELPMAATVNGTVADEAKLEMDMNMTVDISQLMALSQQMGGAELTEEDKAMMDALKSDGIGLAMRGDLEDGTFYMSLSGQLLEEAGVPADTWFSMDMNALMAQAGMGMDWGEYLATIQNVDYAALAKAALSTLSLTDSTVAYDMVKATVEQVVGALCDDGFVKEELDAWDVYTAVVAFEEDGSSIILCLVFGMKDDVVLGYSIGMEVEMEEDGTTTSMSMTISMDDQDQMSGKITLDMAPMMTIDFDITGGYTKGKTAPQTEPPAGANVVDMTDPDAVNAALGVMPLE